MVQINWGLGAVSRCFVCCYSQRKQYILEFININIFCCCILVLILFLKYNK